MRIDAHVIQVASGAVLTIAAAAAFAVVGRAAGQGVDIPSKPVELPNGPAKPGFDLSRFSNFGNGRFETFYVTETQLLRDALNAGRVAEDTRLLVSDIGGAHLALITEQMAYHHIAEGSAGGKDWLVSF
jgi:hypothetical protein